MDVVAVPLDDAEHRVERVDRWVHAHSWALEDIVLDV
jgi:hypothetical protein